MEVTYIMPKNYLVDGEPVSAVNFEALIGYIEGRLPSIQASRKNEKRPSVTEVQIVEVGPENIWKVKGCRIIRK